MLAQGIAHREQRSTKRLPWALWVPKLGVTPQHPMTKGSFGVVVGRLDAFSAHEGPQGRPEVEEVSAGGHRAGVVELMPIPQVIMKPPTQAADVDLEGAPQMNPAHLPASKRQMPVGRIVIGADHRPVIRNCRVT